jgi:hypothetical protein
MRRQGSSFAFAVLVASLSALLTMGAAHSAPPTSTTASVVAEFRGCETAGWCRFWIESLDPVAQSLHHVYPDGVLRAPHDEAVSIAVRDRLNALLASMVHQHKRIVLHDLREAGDGMFLATVTVNEAIVASDPVLLELHGMLTGSAR